MEDALGDRMKEYENQTRKTLDPSMPICVRVDGKSFHRWTSGLDRPSHDLMDAMKRATVATAKEMQGFRVAYTQSDEASFVLMRKTARSAVWFDGSVQKLASVTASIFTAAFASVVRAYEPLKLRPSAVFDGRAWNMPGEDVENYLVWRQKDAIRNSVSMLAAERFSPRQLDGKSTAVRRAMLADLGEPWEAAAPAFRYGIWAYRQTFEYDGTVRHVWDGETANDFCTHEGRAALREFLWDGVDETPAFLAAVGAPSTP